MSLEFASPLLSLHVLFVVQLVCHTFFIFFILLFVYRSYRARRLLIPDDLSASFSTTCFLDPGGRFSFAETRTIDRIGGIQLRIKLLCNQIGARLLAGRKGKLTWTVVQIPGLDPFRDLWLEALSFTSPRQLCNSEPGLLRGHSITSASSCQCHRGSSPIQTKCLPWHPPS